MLLAVVTLDSCHLGVVLVELLTGLDGPQSRKLVDDADNGSVSGGEWVVVSIMMVIEMQVQWI